MQKKYHSFVLQKNGKSFVDLPDRDKKDLLCKMARFDIFDRIFVEAKSRHFSTSQLLGKITKKLDQFESYLISDNNDTNNTNNTDTNNTKNAKNSKSIKTVKTTKPSKSIKSIKNAKTNKTINTDAKTKKLNCNETVKKIETNMNDKLNDITTKIKSEEKSIIILEGKIKNMEISKNKIENKILGYDIKKGLFTNFNHDDNLYERSCLNLVDIINESLKIKNLLKDLKQEKSLNQLKHENNQMKIHLANETERISMSIENYLTNMNVIVMNDIVDTDKKNNNKNLDNSLITLQNKLSTDKTNIDNAINSSIINKNDLIQKLNDLNIFDDQIDDIKNTYKLKTFLEDSIKNIKNKILEDNSNLDQECIMLNDLQNHEYDPNCEKCMKNPVTKDLLRVNQSIQIKTKSLNCANHELDRLLLELSKYDNILFNNLKIDDAYKFIMEMASYRANIHLQIERIDNSINLLRKDNIILETKLDRINNALQQIAINKEIETKIQALKNELLLIRKKELIQTDYEKLIDLQKTLDLVNSRISATLTTLAEMSKKRSYNEQFYKDYVIDTIEMSFLEKNINNIGTELNLAKTLLNKKRQTLNKLSTLKMKIEFDLIKFDEIREEIVSTENRKTILDYIKKALDKNGLVDTLLSKNIIPSLQNNINNILSDVGHYQIAIEYKNQSVNINKKPPTDGTVDYKDKDKDDDIRDTSIVMSSGYESYQLDLIFRLALVQINNHIKTDFLLIDEGFNTCDPDHKNNVKELLEFMRTFYSWILIVSHDEYIKSFYDMSIAINTVQDGSNIRNVD